MWFVELNSSWLELPNWTDCLLEGFILIKDDVVKLSCNETLLEVDFLLGSNKNLKFSSCLSLWENNRCVHAMNRWKICELSCLKSEEIKN